MPPPAARWISAAVLKEPLRSDTAPGVLPDQIDLSISSDLARFIEGPN